MTKRKNNNNRGYWCCGYGIKRNKRNVAVHFPNQRWGFENVYYWDVNSINNYQLDKSAHIGAESFAEVTFEFLTACNFTIICENFQVLNFSQKKIIVKSNVDKNVNATSEKQNSAPMCEWN